MANGLNEVGGTNGAWFVWAFRLIVGLALAAGIADRVRIGDRMDQMRQDISALQTEVRIFHGSEP